MSRPGSASPFNRFAMLISRWAGHPGAFAVAAALVVLWLLSGPLFRFSDTWQLVINTATTIVTFLMVFLIQNSQNREAVAVQIKLDELIRAIEGAHNALLDLEELDEKDLDKIRQSYEDLAADARSRLKNGRRDTNVPSTGAPRRRRRRTHRAGSQR